MSDSPARVRSSLLFSIATLALLLLALGASFGQQPGAIPQFSSIEPHEYDTINLGTLGIQLNVPIRSKAGHIPFSFNFTGTSQVVLNTKGGASFLAQPTLFAQESHVGEQVGSGSPTVCTNPAGDRYTGFFFTDSVGNMHTFPNITVGWATGGGQTCGPTTDAGYAYDNSGLYMTVTMNGATPVETVIDENGNVLSGGSNNANRGFSVFTDPNGNSITGTTAFTDTLNQTAITVTGSKGSSQTATWTDALANNQSVSLTMTQYTLDTAFGCSYDNPNPSTQNFPTSVSFPDTSTMSFGWEKTYSGNGDYTGRLASITLPNGGVISYAYSGGTHGVNCYDGTPATLKRTTPDGTWTYTHTTGANPVTTVTDPQGNNIVYTFAIVTNQPPVQIEKQVYNCCTIASQNLIETIITCYNNPSSTPANCNSTFSPLVSEIDEYTTYPGVTGYSAVKTVYNAVANGPGNGLVTDVKTFDFNATTPTNEKKIVYGSGSPTSQTCTPISTYIVAKPCSVTLLDSQHNNAILSQTWNSYDGNGNLLQTWNLVSGSGASGTYLSKSYAYAVTQNGTPAETNGVVQTMTDVNLQAMNYTTTSCNDMFVTSQYPTNFTNLTTSQTWDCNGGVVTSATDANSQTAHTNFSVGTTADSFYRPLQDVDELGNITSFAYRYTASLQGTTDSQFLFNGNNSVVETLSTTDSIGRPVISQLRQGPSSANWETKSRTFDSDGRVYETSLTCVGAASAACSASSEMTKYDALNRPTSHTGTGGDIVTKTYPKNDVLTTLTPAPTNENAKSVQKEYDGLGRLTSSCLISSAAGSGPCGQANGGTGFLTTYTYDAAGRLLQTVENAQVSSPQQKRSYTYDLLGRVTSETNPEWASAASYTYDSVSGSQACATPTGLTLGSNGDLIKKVDPNGNTTCYFYDGLHRNIAITYAGTNSNGVNKYFVYDAATVDSTAMSNAEGRLAEAYTCSGATLPCSSKITDEGFSYEQRGLLATYYQESPNSGGWYKLAGTYWADKQLETVSGVSVPLLTYAGLDGEGRVQTVSAHTGTNPVSGVAYNNGPSPDDSIGSVLTTTLGTGDTQNFTYDPNSGRMTSYSASVGSTPTVITGSLNWNANGTLQQLNIVDGYNSSDNQYCSYLYDDFVRVAGTTGSTPIPGVNCTTGPNGTGTKVWNQTFTYGSDAFGNITKSSTGPGASWACAACYNTATNQYNNVLSGTITYDLDGNLTNDTFHTYTWLADGHVAAIDTNTITYDAQGNKVEENVGGTIHEYVSALGVSAQMTGQGENATLVDLPGGVQGLYSGGVLRRFRFPDWQGSIRAESNVSTRAFSESLAFAPFGERYVPKGAPYNVDSFTGKPDQIVNDEYDFPAREEHGGQGRWVSPDPMKGTGNKYVYADNNPLSKVDIYGMFAVEVNGMTVSSVDAVLDVAAYHTAYRIAESAPPQSRQTGGQVNEAPSGNSSSSTTQTPQGQQQQQQQGQQKNAEPAKQTQNQADTPKPPQPPPTDPQTGKPTPPPVPVPGCPTCGWVWHDDKQNPRGGRWDPSGWEGPNPPNGSWDPDGHWDINGGKGQPVDHYDPKGNPITPGQAHPGNAPSQFSMPSPGSQAAQTAVKVGVWGTVGAAIIYALGVALGEIN